LHLLAGANRSSIFLLSSRIPPTQDPILTRMEAAGDERRFGLMTEPDAG
jgi:hypothetical protein